MKNIGFSSIPIPPLDRYITVHELYSDVETATTEDNDGVIIEGRGANRNEDDELLRERDVKGVIGVGEERMEEGKLGEEVEGDISCEDGGATVDEAAKRGMGRPARQRRRSRTAVEEVKNSIGLLRASYLAQGRHQASLGFLFGLVRLNKPFRLCLFDLSGPNRSNLFDHASSNSGRTIQSIDRDVMVSEGERKEGSPTAREEG